MSRVRRALISVHDKTGIVDFARGLAALGAEILPTGGTARLLRESGVPVVNGYISDIHGNEHINDPAVQAACAGAPK